MRTTSGPGILLLMAQNQSLNIRCDIDSIEGAFRGELENEQGVSRKFRGWTEFATALVALAQDTKKLSSKSNIEEKTS